MACGELLDAVGEDDGDAVRGRTATGRAWTVGAEWAAVDLVGSASADVGTRADHTSLHSGTIKASEVLRVLAPGGKGITEIGRLDRSAYLSSYFTDELLRRRINTQLNRQESRHNLARKIFHGQKGELRQSYREGQEDQLGALGLMLNIVILWNTVYMQQIIAEMRDEGIHVRAEDIARLSLQGESEAVMGAAAFSDQRPVGVVEEEEPLQLRL
ncbi:hypothetical protein Pth03_33550 [Planotetraspora thailandica]|uniref:Tn3 transposase DDE domain-containing protein n=1 Tax=Planotetraspora thailandica TaxID=487172 RepID=A0A8J3XWQ2_9ACTN|nr:hypothetical protein Pth03_33550 [Planotetraspora thailandica]